MEKEEFYQKVRESLIAKYTNGYEAHFIDKHPHGEFYRNRDNDSGVYCFPEETIMLLNRDGVVVVFLENESNLEEIEKGMKLERIQTE